MTLKVNIHIFGLTRYTAQYTVKNVPVFVYAATTLIFQLKRIQVKNGLTISLLFFFLKMPKIWVGRTTLNGEKEDGLMRCTLFTMRFSFNTVSMVFADFLSLNIYLHLSRYFITVIFLRISSC